VYTSQANCEKGIEALRNQWLNVLESNNTAQGFSVSQQAFQTVRESISGRCRLVTFREHNKLINDSAPEIRAMLSYLGSDEQDHRARAADHLLYLCEKANMVEACKALLQS
jgi:hypothetical protein